MNELKQALDNVQNKKVITAYFNNPEDHEFLYCRVDTLANFAGLHPKWNLFKRIIFPFEFYF